jgi:hypothetical protein
MRVAKLTIGRGDGGPAAGPFESGVAVNVLRRQADVEINRVARVGLFAQVISPKRDYLIGPPTRTLSTRARIAMRIGSGSVGQAATMSVSSGSVSAHACMDGLTDSVNRAPG